MTAAGNRFGFKLFSQLTQGGGPTTPTLKNTFISPPSVMLALTMAWNGAAGPTREAMARTLELNGLGAAEVNGAMKALHNELTSPSQNIAISIANSLWINQTIKVRPDYLALVRQFYAAQVETKDFAAPATLTAINSWVKDQTKGKIPGIIDQLDPSDALVLLNAVYFKGRWQEVFNEKQTKPMPFKLEGAKQGGIGPLKDTPMMNQSGKYSYFKGDGFQLASLPYGDGRFSMVIALPNEGQDLSAFMTKLTPENWDQWMGQMHEADGRIMLPRFKMEYSTGLNDPLKKLGMDAAFSAQADFSGMIAPPPTAQISEVRHKSFVEVNEEGTEAAAVTSVKIRLTSVMPGQPFRLVADHPFFFAIRDNQTGALLFMGVLMEP